MAKTLAGRGDGAAHMEMNFHDLRLGNIGVGPNGPINPEVRFLVGNHAHGTVWCAGTQFMVIWYVQVIDFITLCPFREAPVFDLFFYDLFCQL